MLRLSQRAWNNVLIFSMLFMILIFNTSNNFLLENDNAQEWLPLLPENSVVMSIDYGSTKLQRIGSGWRTTPAQQLEESQLHQLINQWQQTQMQVAADVELTNPVVVVVWLAGKADGRVYQFEQRDNLLHVIVDQQNYQLLNTTLADLVITEN